MTNSVIKDWIKLVEAEATRYEKVKRESERTKQYNKTIQELGKAAYHALKQYGEFHVWSKAWSVEKAAPDFRSDQFECR